MPIGRQVKIVSITGGSSSGTATQIASGYPWIAAIVGPNGSQTFCQLPSGAEVGDVVEVYTDGSVSTYVLPPSGETFLNTNTNPSIGIDEGGVLCRKVSSTVWAWIH